MASDKLLSDLCRSDPEAHNPKPLNRAPNGSERASFMDLSLGSSVSWLGLRMFGLRV